MPFRSRLTQGATAAMILLTLSAAAPSVSRAAEVYQDSFLELEIPEGGSVRVEGMGDYRVLSAPDAAGIAALVARIRLGSAAPAARDLAEAVAHIERTLTNDNYPNLAVEARQKISIAGDTGAVAYTYSYLERGDTTRYRRVRAVYTAHAGHILELRCEAPEGDFEVLSRSFERVLQTLRLYR